jgi:hypothetical protein
MKSNISLKFSNLRLVKIIILLIFAFSSCDENKNNNGFVTFGANFNIINCISNITIYLDDKNTGTLQNPTDTIRDCGQEDCITREISVGKHSYKIEIQPESDVLYPLHIKDSFEIKENDCKKIFIDYLTLWNNSLDCNKKVIISDNEYKNAPDDPFMLGAMEIYGDCIIIRFGASGCDARSWVVKLIDRGTITGSNPYQRTLSLSLENFEECHAALGKIVSFDIQDLQIADDNKVLLNISGNEILYEY